jgi:molybdopterin/thiamine biosynthesis adenylyltransferase
MEGRPPDTNLQMTICCTAESRTWTIFTNSWAAGLQRGLIPWHERQTNLIAAYLAACAAGGEVLRAWARRTAASRAGVPGSRFGARARPAKSRILDLGPATDTLLKLPTLDWVSAGAVNQATLAVLASQPELRLRGRVIDPKDLDPPDLNRSLLSFSSHEGRPKAEIAAEAGNLDSHRGYYPEVIVDQPADWIVTGTDDPRVRGDIQQTRPNTIFVSATEDVHGLSSWHRLGAPGPCAACEIDEAELPNEILPTTAPTSAAPGVLTVARLLQLTAGHAVSPEAVLSTLRLDDDVEHVRNPEPDADCAVCAGPGLSTSLIR